MERRQSGLETWAKLETRSGKAKADFNDYCVDDKEGHRPEPALSIAFHKVYSNRLGFQ
jgi:hypothetical protein